jgi:hypothetical protein
MRPEQQATSQGSVENIRRMTTQISLCPDHLPAAILVVYGVVLAGVT